MGFLTIFVAIGILQGSTTILREDMSTFPGGWDVRGEWVKSNIRYHSSGYSAKTFGSSVYSNYANIIFQKSIDLRNYTSARIKFWVWQNTERNYDFFKVEYYDGTWHTLMNRSGEYSNWEEKVFELPVSATGIRFTFTSDYSVTYEGVYVDDIVVEAEGGGSSGGSSGGDAGNSMEEATLITPGTYTDEIDSNDTEDWYKFEVREGMGITVTMTPPRDADFDLVLYNDRGDGVANSTNGTGAIDEVRYTATLDGYYYAKVFRYSGEGEYQLRLVLTEPDTSSPPPPSGVAKWTIMVYLDADNNLEGYGIQDFNEMEAVGSTRDVNIVVQIDRISGYDYSNGNWTGARRYYITQDSDNSIINSQLVEDLGEVNMGDRNTLVDFVRWAHENYPAEHYMLVLWDHGSGWHKSMSATSPIVKGVAWDDTNGNDYLSFSSGEIGAALSQIKSMLGKNIDVLGVDVCLTGMWEVDDIVSNYADYMVHSEQTEGAQGWYYTGWLSNLVNNPNASGAQVASWVVDAAVGLSTISAIDLSKIDAVTNSVDEFAQALIEARPNYSSIIDNARYNTLSFEISDHVDLYHFAYNIYNSSISSDVKAKARAVMDAINEAVINNKTASGYGNAHGIAIYYPSNPSNYNHTDFGGDYNNLPVARNTHWDEFIRGESGGGNDSYDYTLTTTTYNWIDTRSDLGITGDDQSKVISLPFGFTFYGVEYNSVYVCSNGFMSFTSNSTQYNPASIPNSAQPNALIAPFWRDLNPSADGRITYYAGSDKFVVTWEGVKNYRTDSRQTFQVILYPNGDIVFQYRDITDDVTTVIGIENASGSKGKSAGIPRNGTAYRFVPTSKNILAGMDSGNGIMLMSTIVRNNVGIKYAVNGPTELRINVFDVQGRVVRTERRIISGFGEVSLPVSDLSAGIYTLMATTEDKRLVDKFIVTK